MMDIEKAVRVCMEISDKLHDRDKDKRDAKRPKKLDSARRDKAASTRIRK